jgi:hypothetical protein
MFTPFYLLKTYIRNISLFFISFSPSTYMETTMATTIRARISARGRWVLPSFYFCQVGLQTVEGQFFLFCEN